MSGTGRTISSEAGVPESTASYEALRPHTGRPDVSGARDGLAVLLGQGIAAWMDVLPELPRPRRSGLTSSSRDFRMPIVQSSELTAPLAW